MIQTATYTNQGGRSENEDTIRMKSRGGDRLCLVVADGLGGHGGGQIASSTAADLICSRWQGETDPDLLRDWIQQAHLAVRDHQTETCAMKSTVVVLTISGSVASWAHVGDTRLYHFFNGSLDFQTRDHSASQVAVLLGNITRDQIRFHEDRSRILRALGQDSDTVNAEEGGLTMGTGHHAFLLCTDGFWEYVLEREMEEDLRQSRSPEEWLTRMRTRLGGKIPADNDNNSAAGVWLSF